MPQWNRTTISRGQRVMIEIPYSDRPALRPLVDVLRPVEVLDRDRAVILNEDGTRYAVNGRAVPPVALIEVSIFIDRATGGLWALVYDLPPRERRPYPIDPRYSPVAEPDRDGGIARMLSCWCRMGCVCPTRDEPTVMIPRMHGLEWSTRSLTGQPHSPRCCAPSYCMSTEPADQATLPECCAMPMMLAPIAWVCRRESAHQRPYRWPNHSNE